MNKALDAWMGWSRGYNFVEYQQGEKLAKGRAQSYKFASMCLAFQIFVIVGLINQILQAAPQITDKEKIYKYYKIVALTTIPFAFLVTKIKKDKEGNSIKEKIVIFFNDYVGVVSKIIIIAASITCLVIGDYFTGGSILAGLAYADLNQLGYVPKRIAILVHNYMPILSTIAFALRGQYLEKTYAAISLPFHFFPILMKKLVAEKELQNEKAPIEVVSKMSYTQIQFILDADLRDFQVNKAHASKEFVLSDLEEDYNFEDFLTIFDDVAWLGYNQEAIATFRENLKHNIQLIMSQHEVASNTRKILYHLKKLKEQKDTENIRSIFEVLGRSKEVFLSSRLRANTWSIIDLISRKVDIPYPQCIQKELQILRRSIVENKYMEWVTWYKKLLDPDKVVNFDEEVHTSMYDQIAIDNFFKMNFGFYPVMELNNFSASDWLCWKWFSFMRFFYNAEYISKIDTVFKSEEFDRYFKTWLEQQDQLVAGERLLLLNRYSNTLPEMKASFYRLMLVELGALKYEPQPARKEIRFGNLTITQLN